MTKFNILEIANKHGVSVRTKYDIELGDAPTEEQLRHYTKDIIEMIAKEAEKEDEFALSVGDIRKLKGQI